MNELFASIKQGLQEAVKFAEGDISQAQVFKAPPVDVKIIRSAVRMTQEEFAATFGISLGTLRHWERGDRSPRRCPATGTADRRGRGRRSAGA